MPNKTKEKLLRLAKNPLGCAAIVLGILWAVLAYAVKLQADTVAGEWLNLHAWQPIARAWTRAASVPLGTGGVMVAMTVLALVAIAVLDEAKTVTALRDWWEKRQSAPRKRSWEERQQIQEFRAMWKRSGALAVGNLHAWWDLTYTYIDKKKYYRKYLPLNVSGYVEAMHRMTRLLDDDSNVSLSEVREATEQMYSRYVQLAAYVCELFKHEHSSLGPDDGFLRDFNVRCKFWQEAHADFRLDLERLSHRPENKGMAVYLGPEYSREARDLMEGKPFSALTN